MKRIGFFFWCALVAFTVYAVAGTNDFRVTAIGIEGSDVRVTWQGTGPSNFILQASSTTPTGTWSSISSVFVPSSTLTTTNLVDPNGATNSPVRFYRIKITVPS